MIFTPANLGPDFVSIDSLEERKADIVANRGSCNEYSALHLQVIRRQAVRDFALDLASDLAAESEGYHTWQETDQGRVYEWHMPLVPVFTWHIDGCVPVKAEDW